MQFRPLLLIALASSACLEVDLGSDQLLLDTDDPVQACPIPTQAAIAGNESIFYLCAEEHADEGLGCGLSGYLLGYGSKYSDRFYNQTRPRMSARGKMWIDDVLVCLQRDLRDSIDAHSSCDDIYELAYDSHPACYLDAGVCKLPVFDLLSVLWTIDLRDYLSLDFARQFARVGIGCGNSYAGMLTWLFPALVH